MHVQLFDKGGTVGRDAGLVRLRVAGDGLPRKPGDALTVQVLGAVGLLSDTAPIRDLASFSDWYNCRYYGLILAAYLAFGAVYFAFFFEVFACGEVDCAAAGPALSSAPALPTAANASLPLESLGGDGGGGGDAVPLNRSSSSSSNSPVYPNDAGPWLDALLFELSSATTVGWGSQPASLALPTSPGGREQVFYQFTKIFQSLNILLGIGILSGFVGAVGHSFRLAVHNHIHRCVVIST
jgi:hypothetical protein